MWESEEVYPCLWNGPGTIRGLALVLNYDFVGTPEQRNGSHKDSRDISLVLASLGYQVGFRRNLSYEDTEKVLQEFMGAPQHGAESTDSTVVVVMSHGATGNEWTGSTFLTDDHQSTASQPVVDRFQHVPALKGKPKLFFFNFCRGPLNPSETLVDESEREKYKIKEAKFWMHIETVKDAIRGINFTGRPYEDCLLAYSTLPRFSAFRNNTVGSLFIQAICMALGDPKKVARMDLVSLLYEVDKTMKEVARNAQAAGTPARQTPETVLRGFNKTFYFTRFHRLRNYYLDRICVLVPLPWYPDHSWNVGEIYAEVGIRTLYQGKEFVLLEELFKIAQHGGAYRMVVEGDPGYGKTTLIQKIAFEWSKQASKNYTSEFRLLLLVKLCEIGEQGDVQAYLTERYQDKVDLQLESLLKTPQKEQVLILLDGYDEANAQTKSTVSKIMTNKLWSQCHVVLTSRFGHVANTMKANALCATLRGFQETQVAVAVGKFFLKAGHLNKEAIVQNSLEEVTMEDFKYVQEAQFLPAGKRITTDQFQKLIQKLIEQDPYDDLARSPLLCAMLCCLVGEFPDRELPHTLPELYFTVVNRNLYRTLCKQAEINGEDMEEWNWDILGSTFRQGHEEYLREFGEGCLNYIKTHAAGFTLFELTGNSEVCKANDPKVIRLIEAGVLVKSLEATPSTMYQPTHRTMADFLATCYLTTEPDAEVVSRHLLELCVDNSSLLDICNLCHDMGHGRIVVDSFQDIKLPRDCLKVLRKNPARNQDRSDVEKFWAEMGLAVPGDLCIDSPEPALGQILQHHPSFLSTEIWNGERFVDFEDPEFVAILFDLLKRSLCVEVGDDYVTVYKIAENNSFVSIFFDAGPEDSLLGDLTVIFENLRESRVQLTTVDLFFQEYADAEPSSDEEDGEEVWTVQRLLEETLKRVGEGEISLSARTAMERLARNLNSYEEMSRSSGSVEEIAENEEDEEEWMDYEDEETVDSDSNMDIASTDPDTEDLTEKVKLLLQSGSCPENLIFPFLDDQSLLAIAEGLKDPPENLRFKLLSFDGKPEKLTVEKLIQVLMNYWLPRQLEELDLKLRIGDYSLVKPLIYGLSSFAYLHSLTIAHIQLEEEDLHHFITGILGSQLKKLHLEHTTLTFNGHAEIAKYAPKAKCGLRILYLWDVKLCLKDANIFEWSDAQLPLENLTVSDCILSSKLSDWFGSSIRGLNTLEVNQAQIMTPGDELQMHTLQTLHALTLNNNSTLKTINLRNVQLSKQGMLPQSVKDDLLHCHSLETLLIEVVTPETPETDEPIPSVPQESEAHVPLITAFTEMLCLPKLKDLQLPDVIKGHSERRAFCEAIANLDHRWPGMHAKISASEANASLTLRKFYQDWAALAVLVFRERKLSYHIKYTEDATYEIWFPRNFECPTPAETEKQQPSWISWFGALFQRSTILRPRNFLQSIKKSGNNL